MGNGCVAFASPFDVGAVPSSPSWAVGRAPHRARLDPPTLSPTDISSGAMKLALHTWTLDTTPLPRVLDVIRETGWDGIELRRVDFLRAAEAGETAERVIERVKASGIPVACVGVELGWMWARGDELARLLHVFDEQCRHAAALSCATAMSASDRGRGDLVEAAANVRAVGDIAARHGVRVAVEFNSQAEQFNALAPMRELLARAAHPRCGLLLDAYHLQR